MPWKDQWSSTALIAVLARKGHMQDAINAFQAMNLEGISPDEITFIAILSGCSHVGKIIYPREHFLLIQSDFVIDPIVDHYSLGDDGAAEFVVRQGNQGSFDAFHMVFYGTLANIFSLLVVAAAQDRCRCWLRGAPPCPGPPPPGPPPPGCTESPSSSPKASPSPKTSPAPSPSPPKTSPAPSPTPPKTSPAPTPKDSRKASGATV
ncbi:pentatricopeptide repeat-containing protein At4g16835, mitochondrial-like [Selaginella moellendorffii]|uniref:pentatricopeptide repeat-containing protein At4g16835, mitochondrial-like n=1 Tax=Selaginella moellendorffii TaxID=88036 RepID=UPI000D1CF31A|nr:pentatricopeptide repeat-containing protein At4g16835, mitochondrial-like [Selaginella moellendorffii]|eukprot:XP_024535903.1 pentatricopeptide repeat-containing protein At4g16835, mitochondrial-like [Selaginella moellendorffii]